MSKHFALPGEPGARQREFFESRARYTAYGGARGGGKSWALRRKLTLMALRWPGIKLLLIRRTYASLYANHIAVLRQELPPYIAEWQDGKKQFAFRNGSVLRLGYLADDSDLMQYQGVEYDVIAVDEATQITEKQFDCLRACVRGVNRFPKRMYLTCNPGGVGHAWVKRLFIDGDIPPGESPEDYRFIPARVTDNEAMMKSDPGYVRALSAIRDPKIRAAWIDGDWNVFEGQFFSALSPENHVKKIDLSSLADKGCRLIAGMDYGFDMTALVIVAVKPDGSAAAISEFMKKDLILSEAASAAARVCAQAEYDTGLPIDYIVLPPDLWNRRQDSGRSGVEIMLCASRLPPVRRADARRIPGWQNLREYISSKTPDGLPRLVISDRCPKLFYDLSSLTTDKADPGDASLTPHEVTHSPDALRYAMMSRPAAAERERGKTMQSIWN